jgi:hypothetical protein
MRGYPMKRRPVLAAVEAAIAYDAGRHSVVTFTTRINVVAP